QPEPRSQVVSYADLDLSKHADAAKLYARLRRVASSVCGPVDIRDLSLKRQQRECEEQAVADAVEQVNSAQLTNVHEEKASMRVAQRRSMPAPRGCGPALQRRLRVSIGVAAALRSAGEDCQVSEPAATGDQREIRPHWLIPGSAAHVCRGALRAR